MKIRDSGMPESPLWESFFDASAILEHLGLAPTDVDIADFGCGYGTFALAAARLTTGTVHALDIDPAMVETTSRRATTAGLANVAARQCDLLNGGCGLPAASVGHVLLFNVLHAARPLALLAEACRVTATGGSVLVIHWNPDPNTPRGPNLTIRPTPETCRQLLRQAGLVADEAVGLPPYHFGVVGRVTAA